VGRFLENIMVTVAQLLSNKGNALYSVGSQESVLDAIKRMAEFEIGALLVIDYGKLVGVLSERDYARKVVLKGRSSAEMKVGEIMSSPAITVSSNTTINTCMMVMTERKFRHLPVLDGDTIVGVVSIGDLVRNIIETQQAEIAQLQQYIAG
jgi:CBS domain-containing protein